MKLNLHRIIVFTIIALIALTPLLWFIGRGEAIVNGLDTNFPLDPLIWFTRRLYIWNDAVNGGTHFSSSVGGLFFHLLQLVPYLVGFSLQGVQILNLIFWFGLIVFAAYIFSRTFISRRFLTQLFFTVLYSYNTYLFNTWENVKVANLALVATIPLFLVILRLRFEQKLSIPKTVLLTSIVGIIASGTGINPAYFICLISCLILYFVTYIFFKIKDYKFIIKNFVLILTLIALTNMFWIVPLIDFLFGQSGNTSIQGIGFTNWVDSLSVNTNLLNVIRLQGAWDWYSVDGAGVPYYIPYASRYFYSIPFIMFSFCIPILALLGLITKIKKLNHTYLLFTILVLVGVFLGAGTHPPTGALFTLMLRYIPFFNFFRSPWYIFTPMTIMGLAGLASLFIDRCWTYFDRHSKHIKHIKYLAPTLVVILIFAHGLYSYPMLTGKIFRPGRSDSFYQTFPDYVFEAKDYLESNNLGRIISFPDDQLESFKWGYKGTESILGLFSNTEVLMNSFNPFSNYHAELLNRFYTYVKRSEPELAISMSSVLGFDTILIKEDTTSLSSKSPDFFKDNVSSVEKIGEWSFLQLNPEQVTQRYYVAQNVYQMDITPHALASVTPHLGPSPLVLAKGDRFIESLGDSQSQLLSILAATGLNKSVDNSELTYEVSVPANGSYSLLLSDIKVIDKVREITINNTKVDASEYIASSSDIEIKPRMFPKGNHAISVKLMEQDNLYKQTGQNVQPIVISKESDNIESNVDIPINNFESSKKYQISFMFKLEYGPVPELQLIQYGENAPYKVVKEALQSSNDWQRYTYVFESILLPSKFTLRFSSDKTKGVVSQSLVNDLSVSEIYEANAYLIERTNRATVTNFGSLSYSKKDPTDYTINVNNHSNGFFIGSTVSYHPGWQVSSDSYIGGKQLHFKGNGYANAWFIPVGSEELSLNVKFMPQQYYRFALGVSILTILVAIGYWLYSRKSFSR